MVQQGGRHGCPHNGRLNVGTLVLGIAILAVTVSEAFEAEFGQAGRGRSTLHGFLHSPAQITSWLSMRSIPAKLYLKHTVKQMEEGPRHELCCRVQRQRRGLCDWRLSVWT